MLDLVYYLSVCEIIRETERERDWRSALSHFRVFSRAATAVQSSVVCTCIYELEHLARRGDSVLTCV